MVSYVSRPKIQLKAEEKKKIHRKAALVFLKRKDFVGASKHYLVSEDPEHAAQVLKKGVKRMLHEQRFLTVSELLSRVPRRMIFSSPTLCIAQGKALQNQGDYNSAGLWYKKAIRYGEKEQERALALASWATCTGARETMIQRSVYWRKACQDCRRKKKGGRWLTWLQFICHAAGLERPKESQVR